MRIQIGVILIYRGSAVKIRLLQNNCTIIVIISLRIITDDLVRQTSNMHRTQLKCCVIFNILCFNSQFLCIHLACLNKEQNHFKYILKEINKRTTNTTEN